MKTKIQLRKEKIKAKQYIKSWSKSGSYSPALNRKVYVNDLIWEHLVTHKNRTKEDVIKRFKALPKAKRILESQSQIYERRSVKDFQYAAVQGKNKDQIIRVVIANKVKRKLFLFSIIVLDQPTKKEASPA